LESTGSRTRVSPLLALKNISYRDNGRSMYWAVSRGLGLAVDLLAVDLIDGMPLRRLLNCWEDDL
jgi:hypothetical protein